MKLLISAISIIKNEIVKTLMNLIVYLGLIFCLICDLF